MSTESVVIGVGKTGMSCVRYWQRQGESVCVMDTRINPAGLADIQAQFAEVSWHIGRLDIPRLKRAKQVVVSPGIPLHHPALVAAAAAGVVLYSDIDYFSAQLEAPIIGVTGSNGKSTVTHLVAACCEAAGMVVGVGGNIGRPALDLLDGSVYDVVVLELSSFQLASIRSARLAAGCLLNISVDHMDWHGSMAAYIAAKQSLAERTDYWVASRDDAQTLPQKAEVTVGTDAPSLGHWGLRHDGSKVFIMYGDDEVLDTDRLQLWGAHQWSNVMVAAALAHRMGVALAAIQTACEQFPGLPHRCRKVHTLRQVAWYNDSKGTNPGATLAALAALRTRVQGRVLLLLGGVTKNADLSVLQADVLAAACVVIVFGQDARAIAAALSAVDVFMVEDLPMAVKQAVAISRPGDAVLFSPACASWDQYRDYAQRGEHFESLVRGECA